jgi:tRNA (adenine22-N1)-methyltransferase
VKLSKRLTQIEALITTEYNHIWDTCCDHGLLGTHLILNQKAANIHLVDIVPQLIESVNEKLSRLFANPFCNTETHSNIESNPYTHWQTHCLDIAKLPLEQYPGKHLIIIAGIGGNLMIECMRSIISQFPTLEIDFLLCPVRHLHTLRQQLIELKLTLKKEVLLKDNKIFYEILLLSNTPLAQGQLRPLNPVSPIGETLWQGETATEKSTAQEYLELKIKHYQRMQHGPDDPEINAIIQAYQAVQISLKNRYS